MFWGEVRNVRSHLLVDAHVVVAQLAEGRKAQLVLCMAWRIDECRVGRDVASSPQSTDQALGHLCIALNLGVLILPHG